MDEDKTLHEHKHDNYRLGNVVYNATRPVCVYTEISFLSRYEMSVVNMHAYTHSLQ